MTSTRQLDEAMDFAARLSKATVGEFLAAIVRRDAGADTVCIAVEFLVPPASIEQFETELDRAMIRRSLEYSMLRRSHQVGALRLEVIPPGTFHQWRVAYRVNSARQHARRWCADAEMLDALLHQSQFGWSELSATV